MTWSALAQPAHNRLLRSRLPLQVQLRVCKLDGLVEQLRRDRGMQVFDVKMYLVPKPNASVLSAFLWADVLYQRCIQSSPE